MSTSEIEKMIEDAAKNFSGYDKGLDDSYGESAYVHGAFIKGAKWALEYVKNQNEEKKNNENFLESLRY